MLDSIFVGLCGVSVRSRQASAALTVALLAGAGAWLPLGCGGQVNQEQDGRTTNSPASGGAPGSLSDETTAEDASGGSSASAAGGAQQDDLVVDETGPTDATTGLESSPCSCAEDESFKIELEIQPLVEGEALGEPEHYLFDRGAEQPDFQELDCEPRDVPSLFAGGSCLSTQVAGCSSDGHCIHLTERELIVTDSDGSQIMWGGTPSLEAEGFTSISIDDLVGRGAFEYLGHDTRLRGTYAACYAGGDRCLK